MTIIERRGAGESGAQCHEVHEVAQENIFCLTTEIYAEKNRINIIYGISSYLNEWKTLWVKNPVDCGTGVRGEPIA